MPSLNEFFESEVADDVVVDTPDVEEVDEVAPEGEASGGSPESEEPAGTPEPLDDAAEPGEPDAAVDGETPDDEAPPAVDEDSEDLGELTKRGWPKPPYTEDQIKNDPLAKSVHDHWHRVHSMSRREEKEWRKQYDGLDPNEIQQYKAVYEDITANEQYEGVRAFIGMSKHPAGDDARTFVTALSDARHPDHLRALRAWQQIRAGGPTPSPSAPQPTQSYDNIVDQFTDEYGGIDAQKFAAAMQTRDRQIAERVLEAVKQQQGQTESAAPPRSETQTRDAVQEFAEFQGLAAPEIRPLLLRQLHLRRAAGQPDPEDSVRGVKELWDAVVAERDTQVRAERQAETARLKGVSTSKPREAVPDTGTPAKGSTLYQFLARENP